MSLTPSEEFLLSDSSSDDDSDDETLFETRRRQMVVPVLAVKEFEDRFRRTRQGSKAGRLCIPRNRFYDNQLLMRDYFAENPTYPAHIFQRRYRMRRSLFVKIVRDCEANCRYFTRRRNVAGLLGFSAHQKISAAMRVIAYGIPADYADEYLRIGEDTMIESVRTFAKTIIRLYGKEYLRAPNEDNTMRLRAVNEKRGWSDILGSIDCMHCEVGLTF